MAPRPDPPDGSAPPHYPVVSSVLSFPAAARAVTRERPPSALLLTPRDLTIFRDVYRFGCLSAGQLSRRYWPDSASPKTALNRLRELATRGYLRRQSLGVHEDGVYTLAHRGRAELELPTRHARPTLAATSLRHRLVVADVADSLLARAYRGGTPEWLTETDVYDGRVWLPRPETKARGKGALMVPDGVLVLTGGERVWRLAVEVELHEKASRLYDAKCALYAHQLEQDAIDAVLWLVRRPGRAAPILASVRRVAPDATKLVQVSPLPEHVTPY